MLSFLSPFNLVADGVVVLVVAFPFNVDPFLLVKSVFEFELGRCILFPLADFAGCGCLVVVVVVLVLLLLLLLSFVDLALFS